MGCDSIEINLVWVKFYTPGNAIFSLFNNKEEYNGFVIPTDIVDGKVEQKLQKSKWLPKKQITGNSEYVWEYEKHERYPWTSWGWAVPSLGKA